LEIVTKEKREFTWEEMKHKKNARDFKREKKGNLRVILERRVASPLLSKESVFFSSGFLPKK